MRKQLTSTVRYYPVQRATSLVPGLEDEVVEVLVNLDLMLITSDYGPGKRLLELKFDEQDVEMPRAFQYIQESTAFLKILAVSGYALHASSSRGGFGS
jgi:hypothetical protein